MKYTFAIAPQKNLFLEMSQYSQENTCVGVSCEIFEKTCFEENSRMAASASRNISTIWVQHLLFPFSLFLATNLVLLIERISFSYQVINLSYQRGFISKVFPRRFYVIEAVTQRCSVIKVILEILQNSLENTLARVYLLIKLQD